MKGFGIFLVIIGILALMGGIIRASNGSNPMAVRQLFVYIGIIGAGIYLINRAENKKRKQSDKDKWENS
ncbi:MAG: hypothetical protein LBJ63_03615 [Prevotellaceae bacterium]|jgi:hypothetical protein|nr:hypothetical protein [Prevotellaceae bacterium]